MVRESYEVLASQYDVVILEGAGSPAEINLKQHDIANMRMAAMADARCLLVGDIDRGGVFASLLGTLELLEPEERERVCGFVINKFRGDASLLEPGIRLIEDRVQKRCLGVMPYLRSLMLEEEDSLGLPATTQGQMDGGSALGRITPPQFARGSDRAAIVFKTLLTSIRFVPSRLSLFCSAAQQKRSRKLTS